MRFFTFLSRNISYTFSIVFYMILVVWAVSLLGMYFGYSFLLLPDSRVEFLIFRWVPLAVIVATFIAYVQLGFFTPLGLPAFSKSHRLINRAYKSGYDLNDVELEKAYNNFTKLPNQISLTAFVYIFIFTLLICCASYYEYKYAARVSLGELISLNKTIGITMLIIMMLSGMFTYLLTKVLISKESAVIYNRIFSRGIKLETKLQMSLRNVNVFVLIFVATVLLSYSAAFEKMRLFDKPIIWISFGYIVIAIVVGSLILWINTNSIINVLGDLKRLIKSIASGETPSVQFLALDRDLFEAGRELLEMNITIDGLKADLQNKIIERDTELKSALDDLNLKKSQIEKQLDMAAILQRSILPGIIDDWNELKFCLRYIAMEHIGGDFYDVYQLKNDKLGLMIADVSGHGIAASLVTAIAKISFGDAERKFDSPRRIFQEVNDNILDNVKSQDPMSCFMVVFDDEYNVTYSNASHQKAILLRSGSGSTEFLDTNGIFIGAIREAINSYEDKSIKLNYGDRIILYTDGITQAQNSERKEYTIERLEESIIKNKALPLAKFSDKIIEDVRNFIGGKDFQDDVTLLVVELKRDEAVDIVKEADRLINVDRDEEAISLLEKGRQDHPDNKKISYNLAKIYFRILEYEKAIESIEKYIARNRRNKYAFYISGASHYKLGNYTSAIDNFDRSLQIDPYFTNSLFAMGMATKKAGEKEKAKRIFERLVSIEPENKMALFELKQLS
ncbi:SpoIIE family protein phosphatase [Spirochaetota bacterium]